VRPGAAPRQPQPKLVSRVRAVYPPEAKAKGIKGTVILEARINPAGQVIDVKVLRSIPALDQAAIDAVRQWRFEPQPTEKAYVATIRFQPGGND
jgi:protein TonB